MADGAWEPVVGDRVRLVKTGETGTVLRLSLTEWGLLCDLELDPAPGLGTPGGAPARRVHASTELQPLAGEGSAT